MTRDLVHVLCCPACRSGLALTEAVSAEGEVVTGTLGCGHCGAEFPVVRGIPRFVREDGYVRSFSYEWNRWSRVQLDAANGNRESEDTFTAKTGLTAEDVRGRAVLDVGCGAGRFSDVASRWGGRVVAVDLSYAVEAARRNLADRDNVNIVQADIRELPFRDGAFDVVFSIGVLHHTPDTRQAFGYLPRLVGDTGVLAVWLYHYTDPVYCAASDFWRAIFSRAPRRLAYMWCRLMVLLLWPLYQSRAIRSSLLRHLPRLVPVSPGPTFEARVLDTFDWWTPRYQDKACAPRRVMGWFRDAGLRDIDVLPVDTAVRGRRDDAQRYPEFRRFIPASRATRFVVFGAGSGGELALERLREAGLHDRVVAVCDNDGAKYGQRVGGHVVRAFASVPRTCYDFVVIASSGGYEAIGRQLEAAGLSEGTHFGTADLVTVLVPAERAA